MKDGFVAHCQSKWAKISESSWAKDRPVIFQLPFEGLGVVKFRCGPVQTMKAERGRAGCYPPKLPNCCLWPIAPFPINLSRISRIPSTSERRPCHDTVLDDRIIRIPAPFLTTVLRRVIEIESVLQHLGCPQIPKNTTFFIRDLTSYVICIPFIFR